MGEWNIEKSSLILQSARDTLLNWNAFECIDFGIMGSRQIALMQKAFDREGDTIIPTKIKKVHSEPSIFLQVLSIKSHKSIKNHNAELFKKNRDDINRLWIFLAIDFQRLSFS